MRRFAEEYAKHTVLNLGQALQGLRYFYSHPDVDAEANRGSLRHVVASCRIRAKRVLNDLFFAAIPPHWHHSAAELEQFAKVPAALWFQYGYCAWKFDETGQRKQVLGPDVDRRWDPRCKDRP